MKNEFSEADGAEEIGQTVEPKETPLYSTPLLFVAAIPPVVIFVKGGYGTYRGFRIRFSDGVEEKANAKDLHPKLLAGVFFFFALGATGGITSLLQTNPIFDTYC